MVMSVLRVLPRKELDVLQELKPSDMDSPRGRRYRGCVLRSPHSIHGVTNRTGKLKHAAMEGFITAIGWSIRRVAARFLVTLRILTAIDDC